MKIIYALFTCLALSCGEEYEHHTSYGVGPVSVHKAHKGYDWRDAK